MPYFTFTKTVQYTCTTHFVKKLFALTIIPPNLHLVINFLFCLTIMFNLNRKKCTWASGENTSDNLSLNTF